MLNEVFVELLVSKKLAVTFLLEFFDFPLGDLSLVLEVIIFLSQLIVQLLKVLVSLFDISMNRSVICKLGIILSTQQVRDWVLNPKLSL